MVERDDVTRLVREQLRLGGLELELERPADAAALIDEERFADDEFLPYWAEQWPSGIALAGHLGAADLSGARVLELGCGLGLPSLVAAARGGHVVATDWSPDALALLRRNAARNGVSLAVAAADWRHPDAFPPLGPFDLVLGADVLYEARNVVPLASLLRLLGAPALIADPGRRHADGFLDAVRREGWTIETRSDERIPRGGIHCLERQQP